MSEDTVKVTRYKELNWFTIGITILGFGCIIGISGLFFVSYLFSDILESSGVGGTYTISEVILTNELNEDGRPIGRTDKFKPYEKIIGWVSTEGVEGIIGMRWYYEDELIFEHFGKTEDNQIFTFIESNAAVTLPEGEYRLDIHITETPHQSLKFIVEQYQPEVSPSQPTPIGHNDAENSAFVDVPFAFDETWQIGETDWQINEVKITFLGDEVFVSIAVETDLDLAELSESEAFAITKSIATYAVKKGYLEQARELQVDGEFYPLDEVIYVNLINRISDDPLNQIGRPVFRLGFNLRDLMDSQG